MPVSFKKPLFISNLFNILYMAKQPFYKTGKGIALIVVVLAVLALVGWLVGTYNSFITLDQTVKGKWSQVENVYQRQADLIPNFVETAKQYAEFEKTLLTQLTDARSKWTASVGLVDKDKAGLDMNTALQSSFSRLIAVAESYPQLKTSDLYRGVQDELAGSQNRISTERGRYIQAIQDFNTALKRFPANLLAGPFGFTEKQYYQAGPGSLNTPNVGDLFNK